MTANAFLKQNGRLPWGGLLAALAALVGQGACAHSHTLTQGEVGRAGTHQFSAPTERVFPACVGALGAAGYEIASADSTRGLIVTGLLPVPAADPPRRRGYRVTVSSEGDGSRVVAQPVLFAGDRDISTDDVWDVDGERASWNDLFDVIGSALSRPALDGRDRDALTRDATTSSVPGPAAPGKSP